MAIRYEPLDGGMAVAVDDFCGSAAALARRSVARSGLDGRAAVLCASWTDLDGLLPREGFHLVVCNPPYFPPGSGRESASPADRLARHEPPGTLDEVVAAASRLLRFGGRFCLCHRPERLADVVAALRRRGLEPKPPGCCSWRPKRAANPACDGNRPGCRTSRRIGRRYTVGIYREYYTDC